MGECGVLAGFECATVPLGAVDGTVWFGAGARGGVTRAGDEAEHRGCAGAPHRKVAARVIGRSGVYGHAPAVDARCPVYGGAARAARGAHRSTAPRAWARRTRMTASTAIPKVTLRMSRIMRHTVSRSGITHGGGGRNPDSPPASPGSGWFPSGGFLSRPAL